jgi:hypothetical protein
MLQSVRNVYSLEHVEPLGGRMVVHFMQAKNLAPISFEADSLLLTKAANQGSS